MSKAQFDRSEVIHAATQLFWQSGYHAASMQQLFTVTGLKPGSLYLAFGNKDGLFKTALSHYAETSISGLRSTIESAPTVGEGICQVLIAMIEDAEQCDYCSCFLVKSQLELTEKQSDLRDFVEEQLQSVEVAYRSFLAQETDSDTATARASSLLMNIFGLRVYGYLQKDPEKMLTGLKASLAWLPWERVH